MRRRMGSAYDRLAEGSCQTSQSSARGDRPGKAQPFWRIFSTMAVVELFSTRPSTRTSPP